MNVKEKPNYELIYFRYIVIALITFSVNTQLNAQKGLTPCNPLEINCNKQFHWDSFLEMKGANSLTLPCAFTNALYAGVWLSLDIENDANLIIDLVPDVTNSDLDFAVYKQNNDCNQLELLRCSAAENNLASDKTGLRAESTDTNEGAGKAQGQDAYLSSLPVTEGERLLILVHNFSNLHGGNIVFSHSVFGGYQADKLISSKYDLSNSTLNLALASNSFVSDAEILWQVTSSSGTKTLEGAGPHNIFVPNNSNRIKLTISHNETCIDEYNWEKESDPKVQIVQSFPNPARDQVNFDFVNIDITKIKSVYLMQNGKQLDVISGSKISNKIFNYKCANLPSGNIEINVILADDKVIHNRFIRVR